MSRTTKEQQKRIQAVLHSDHPSMDREVVDLLADFEELELRVQNLECRLRVAERERDELKKAFSNPWSPEFTRQFDTEEKWQELSMAVDHRMGFEDKDRFEYLSLRDKLDIAVAALEKCRRKCCGCCPDPDVGELNWKCRCGADKHNVWLDEVLAKVKS